MTHPGASCDESDKRECSDQTRSAPLRERKPQQGPNERPFVQGTQPLRRWVGRRQPLTVANAQGLVRSGLLLGSLRRNAGQFVEVRDDAGQDAEHTGAVERDGFPLGIGLGSQVDDTRFAALQTIQPIAAPADIVSLPGPLLVAGMTTAGGARDALTDDPPA